MEEQKNYQDYTFRPTDKLEVDAQVMGMVRQLLEEIIGTHGVGSYRLTSPKFEYVHNETGVPAKEKTSKAKLDKEYTRVFSLDKTISSNGDEFVTDLGKKALSLTNILNVIHKENIDGGKGGLRAEIEAEMQAAQQPAMAPVEEDKKIILEKEE